MCSSMFELELKWLWLILIMLIKRQSLSKENIVNLSKPYLIYEVIN